MRNERSLFVIFEVNSVFFIPTLVNIVRDMLDKSGRRHHLSNSIISSIPHRCSRLKVFVFALGVKAGAGLVDTGEVAVALDDGVGVAAVEVGEESQECGLLCGCAVVHGGECLCGRVHTAYPADGDGNGVVAFDTV